MTDPNCVFCKIASGAIPAKRIVEDEHGLAFPDLNPQAPVHVLIIPKAHHASFATMPEADSALPGRLLWLARRAAQLLGVAERGYRLVMNTGEDGVQTVGHVHVHLLAGRTMTWPPG